MKLGDKKRRAWLAGAIVGAAAVVGVPAALRGTAEAQVGIVPAPPGAVVLFDGRDLSKWTKRGGGDATWKVVEGAMVGGGGDILSKDRFQDCQLHVEFMTPYMPNARGQARGNSGVYLQGRYEIQVLDSYGKPEPGTGDCGAVYGQSAALVNACKPPLQWQTYDIIYRAPRFGPDRKLTAPSRITVLQNGTIIQNNTEIAGGTVASVTGEDPATPGPVLLQDHGNPVKYRNVWVLPLPAKGSDKYE